MPILLSLTFGNPPVTQEFPGTPKALGDFLASYFEITGGENFIPVNFGPNTPDADSRGYPWFKTDSDGNPIGWYSWNGVTWDQLNTNVPNGTTAQRPSDAVLGDLYYDTDISVELIFNGSAWVTASGSPGDVKFVKASTIDAALTSNPGWSQDPDSLGRVIGAAGDGAGLTPRAYGDAVGEEDTTLALDNMPAHQHSTYVAELTRYNATGQVTNAAGVLAGWVATQTGYTPSPGSDSNPINTMQPTVFYWAIVKD